MSNEEWHSIKKQVLAQVAELELMDFVGKETYHVINNTCFRNLSNSKYVPLRGVNVESLWASADAQIKNEEEKNKKWIHVKSGRT